jgi:hypothetical protein
MGGTDDPSNLVELSVEDHAAAHMELYEKHGNQFDLIAARMLRKEITGKEARILASIAATTPEVLERRGRSISMAKTGAKYDENYSQVRKVACANMHKGEENPFYGKAHTEETKAKIALSSKRRVWYNDGASEIYQDKDLPVPNGFVRGRVFRKRNRK